MNAATHTTVLLQEAVESLLTRPDGIYVDCTFGRGGHSRRILEQLDERGRLIAIDRDQAAHDANTIRDARFSLHHAAMSEIDSVLDHAGVDRVDGVLADLGVSSPQLDDAERGFSFRFDAPLDMRMDQTKGETVSEWLAHAAEKQIEEVIRDYGEERFAKAIARKIVATRQGDVGEVGVGSERGRLRTTRQLAELVASVVRTREPGQHPATRTFQALRIHINQELEEVSKLLPRATARLRPEGRLAVISFHSLEDRIVKRFLQAQARKDSLPSNFPIRANEINEATLVPIGRAIRPSDAEVANNPRARSAILRVAARTDVAWTAKAEARSHV